ncbi:protein phosphatase 2C domain-containing protein [Streptomyces sp. NBC_00385]|uniref:protein phosphatase 2C domain-containing protein n=1 Tax=Streptomyces sp. NBC_00385 TaxID=2975733 RepID=UPI002DDC43FB|nr:protein phosphatase 2C domain-containing protein [Streptomyces sp. NBC_00385]WRZ02853.1 protein phosphatase 2C domain-containing protein [Streptomyces sp. NBC_00385]
MSQQGERPAAHEDDWWRRLYDDSAPDAGASQAADSLDDRFDSASGAVGSDGGEAYGTAAAVPEPRAAASAVTRTADPAAAPPPSEVTARAPWEPPAGPPRPRTFAGAPPPPPPPPSSAPTPAPVVAPPPSPVLAPEPQWAPADPRIAQSLPVPAEPEAAPSAPAVPPVPPEPPAPAGVPTVTVRPPAEPDEAVPPLPRRPVVERTHDTAPPGPAPEPAPVPEAPPPPVVHVGARPPTYDAEPTALPESDPRELDGLVADTVLDGARYGTYTLRAASVRGDSARFRGEPRRDALLTTRFGTAEGALVLVAVAGGARSTESGHLAAADACRWIAEAVGRSHARLADDIRAGRRGDLKSGLHRLTDRGYGKLRARAAELGREPHEYTVGLRCLLLSADPECRTRVFFGVGDGGLFRLRDGSWHDLEPIVPRKGALTGEAVVGFGSSVPESGPGGDRLTMDLGVTTAPAPYVEDPVPLPAEPFRFRASVARPGDTLLLCSPGLAEPLRGEPALAAELAERWTPAGAPGLGAFLADTQLRVKGYADDRTAVGVWEA